MQQLPSEVAELYELVNWKGGRRQVFGRFGLVDLDKLTVAKANNLAAKGFKKLRLKQAPEAAPQVIEPEDQTTDQPSESSKRKGRP